MVTPQWLSTVPTIAAEVGRAAVDRLFEVIGKG